MGLLKRSCTYVVPHFSPGKNRHRVANQIEVKKMYKFQSNKKINVRISESVLYMHAHVHTCTC